MTPLTVFLTMAGAGLAYAMMFGTKPENVRVLMVANRRYRVTKTGSNEWRIERIDDAMGPVASADYRYGEDIRPTLGATEVIKQLAQDMLYFPANLFS